MAIKNFEDKKLNVGKKVTENNKSAIIEDKHCYPQYGITVKAKDKKEADEKVKKLIKQ